MRRVAEPKSDFQAGATVGQYTITRRIGTGGMGEVYEAVHAGLDKKVAIKTLRREHAEHETIVARFLREGQVASRIHHPNIVNVTDVGVIEGLPCLIMEYLEGEPLQALFKREKLIPVSRLVDLLLPVIAAVHAAHNQGVIHRDLKPANIFLARTWTGEVEPKVLDFGISKLMQDPGEITKATSSFLGSPHYASPELARGDKGLDARSDQYALGVILYEGSCGVRPFAHRAESFMSLMYAITEADYLPPRHHRPELPAAFEAAVLRAMAKHREDRYPSVHDLGRALLPFASARAKLLWEPVFGTASPGVSETDATLRKPEGVTFEPERPQIVSPPRTFQASQPSISGSLAQPVVPTQLPETTAAPQPKSTWREALRFGVASFFAFVAGIAVAWGTAKLVAVSKHSDPTVFSPPQKGIEAAPSGEAPAAPSGDTPPSP